MVLLRAEFTRDKNDGRWKISLSAELKCIDEHIVRIRLAFEGSYAASVWPESFRCQFGVSRVRHEVCRVDLEGQELLSDCVYAVEHCVQVGFHLAREARHLL